MQSLHNPIPIHRLLRTVKKNTTKKQKKNPQQTLNFVPSSDMH